MFGGSRNYYNLWLYAAAAEEKNENIPGPDPIYWCGIYHPDADKFILIWKNTEKISVRKENLILAFCFTVKNGYGKI